MTCDFILASGSPRRREILARMGFNFKIVPADIDESLHRDLPPAAYAAQTAALKGRYAASSFPDQVVVAADTIVTLDGQIFGKPKDAADAKAMLMTLAGRTHEVITSVFMIKCPDHTLQQTVSTKVTFADVSPELIDIYVASGESADKSGSYALQGIAAMLIRRVEGSVSSVVGLPACETREMLAQFGIYPRPVKAEF